jgi:hypothetical protein
MKNLLNTLLSEVEEHEKLTRGNSNEPQRTLQPTDRKLYRVGREVRQALRRMSSPTPPLVNEMSASASNNYTVGPR